MRWQEEPFCTSGRRPAREQRPWTPLHPTKPPALARLSDHAPALRSSGP
jgi:hypothetical protein